MRKRGFTVIAKNTVETSRPIFIISRNTTETTASSSNKCCPSSAPGCLWPATNYAVNASATSIIAAVDDSASGKSDAQRARNAHDQTST
jgi:hypothetical protein